LWSFLPKIFKNFYNFLTPPPPPPPYHFCLNTLTSLVSLYRFEEVAFSFNGGKDSTVNIFMFSFSHHVII
jgi:hypothetical protein